MSAKMSDLEKLEEMEFYFTDLLDSIRVIKKCLKENFDGDISEYVCNVHKKVDAIYEILYAQKPSKR